MQIVYVESVNVWYLRYNDNKTMDVYYKNGVVIRYYNVEQMVFLKVANSQSVGAAIAEITARYKHERITQS